MSSDTGRACAVNIIGYNWADFDSKTTIRDFTRMLHLGHLAKEIIFAENRRFCSGGFSLG